MKLIKQLLVSGLLCASSTTLCYGGKPLTEFIENIPGSGLITDEIDFDGVKIKDFHFDNGDHIVFVKPGEEVPVHFDYFIDSDKLDTLHLYHLIIGLNDVGPQECVLRSLGIMDSEGEASLKLKAPQKKGAYQVRFSLSKGLTDSQAMKAWNEGAGPSAKTIAGIVVVK